VSTPQLRFLSLFVDDLESARKTYAEVFGLQPLKNDDVAPLHHPYSPAPPVVFDLGGTRLALYQVDGCVTHPGDVGLGVFSDEEVGAMAARVTHAGGQVLGAPDGAPASDPLLVFALPGRHFFEVKKVDAEVKKVDAQGE